MRRLSVREYGISDAEWRLEVKIYVVKIPSFLSKILRVKNKK